MAELVKSPQLPFYRNNPDAWLVLGGRHWDETVAAFIQPYIEDLVTRAAEQAFGRVAVAGAFNVEAPAAMEYAQNHAYAFARKINQATADRVRDAVQQVISEGLDFDALVERLKFLPPTTSEAIYRAEMVAQTEYARAMRKGEIIGWKEAGVSSKIWRTSPDCCTFCAAMDGTQVPIDDIYASAGTIIQDADGREFTVSSYDRLDIAQLHPWCRCWGEPVIEPGDIETLTGEI